MLRVFIVEDDENHRELIESSISDLILFEELNATVELATEDPYKCLEYLQKTPDIKGLYFLDYQLGTDINGLELAQRIREMDPNGRIVIVTVEGSMAFLTFSYRIEVLDYIIKSSVEEMQIKVRACVKTAYQRYTKMNPMERQVLEIDLGRKLKTFPFKEVYYVETTKKQGHHLALYTSDGKVEFRGNLSSLKLRYPYLIESHRGVLVNLDNVVCFDDKLNTLKMKNGALCPVSSRKLARIKKELSKREKW